MSSDPWSKEPRSGVKTPILYSYAHVKDRSEEEQRWMITNPAYDILIDSGGFTALNAGYEINLDEYMEWLLKWKDHLYAYIALDKLGDSKQTDANLRIMQNNGLSPVPVHVRGDDEARMDELFEMNDYVALGGLRRPHRGPASNQYVAQKMRWAKGRKVHWLGWTDLRAIAHFKPHSVDSSTWGSAQRYGRLDIYKGRGHWFPQIGWHDGHCKKSIEAGDRLSPAEARTVRNAGMRESWLYQEDRWWPRLGTGCYYENSVSTVGAHSWVRYVDDIRRWYGTRHFLACSVGPAKNWMVLKWAKCLYGHGRACMEDHSKLPSQYVAPEVIADALA